MLRFCPYKFLVYLLQLYDHPVIHLFTYHYKSVILCLPCESYCIKYRKMNTDFISEGLTVLVENRN